MKTKQTTKTTTNTKQTNKQNKQNKTPKNKKVKLYLFKNTAQLSTVTVAFSEQIWVELAALSWFYCPHCTDNIQIAKEVKI